MIFRTIGWAVVDSLWQGTFTAGFAALIFSLVGDARARARYLVACASLTLMTLAPLATAATGMRMVRSSVGPQLLPVVDRVVDVPALIWLASMVVPILGAAWIAGFAGYLLGVSREIRRVRALRQSSRDDSIEVDEVARAVTADVASRMSLTAVEVRASRHATTPMMLGWRQPIVLLPEEISARLEPAQLRAVVAHELAHVRRGDYAVNVLQIAAETLLFFHPAARWTSRRIRIEREYCCDDVAVTIAGDPRVYAHALAALDAARHECRPAIAVGSGTLLDRIQRIAGAPRRVLTPARGVAAMLMASLVATTILAGSILIPPSLPFGSRVRKRIPPPNGQIVAPPGDNRPGLSKRSSGRL